MTRDSFVDSSRPMRGVWGSGFDGFFKWHIIWFRYIQRI